MANAVVRSWRSEPNADDAKTWPAMAENRDKLLINHWELFNTIMANQFGISKEDMIHPEHLSEIVIKMCCPIEELTA